MAHRPHQALASPDALTVPRATGRGVGAGTAPVTRGRLPLALRSKGGVSEGSGPKANIGSPPRAEPVFSPNLDQLCLRQTQPAMPPCPHAPLPPTAFPELGKFWGCLSAGPAETKAQRTPQTATAGPGPGGLWFAPPHGPCPPRSPTHQWEQHSLAGKEHAGATVHQGPLAVAPEG